MLTSQCYLISFCRFQGADLWCVQIFTSSYTGGADQCHFASWNSGDDQQIHDRPHSHLGETVSFSGKSNSCLNHVPSQHCGWSGYLQTSSCCTLGKARLVLWLYPSPFLFAAVPSSSQVQSLLEICLSFLPNSCAPPLEFCRCLPLIPQSMARKLNADWSWRP